MRMAESSLATRSDSGAVTLKIRHPTVPTYTGMCMPVGHNWPWMEMAPQEQSELGTLWTAAIVVGFRTVALFVLVSMAGGLGLRRLAARTQ